jgi:hypothetical protein
MSKHKNKSAPPTGPLPEKMEEVDALRWYMLNEKTERIKSQITALVGQQNQTQAELQAHLSMVLRKYQIDANTNVDLSTGVIHRKPAPKNVLSSVPPPSRPETPAS